MSVHNLKFLLPNFIKFAGSAGSRRTDNDDVAYSKSSDSPA